MGPSKLGTVRRGFRGVGSNKLAMSIAKTEGKGDGSVIFRKRGRKRIIREHV